MRVDFRKLIIKLIEMKYSYDYFICMLLGIPKLKLNEKIHKDGVVRDNRYLLKSLHRI